MTLRRFKNICEPPRAACAAGRVCPLPHTVPARRGGAGRGVRDLCLVTEQNCERSVRAAAQEAPIPADSNNSNHVSEVVSAEIMFQCLLTTFSKCHHYCNISILYSTWWPLFFSILKLIIRANHYYQESHHIMTTIQSSIVKHCDGDLNFLIFVNWTLLTIGWDLIFLV